jgi:hypothetical protein
MTRLIYGGGRDNDISNGVFNKWTRNLKIELQLLLGRHNMNTQIFRGKTVHNCENHTKFLFSNFSLRDQYIYETWRPIQAVNYIRSVL